MTLKGLVWRVDAEDPVVVFSKLSGKEFLRLKRLTDRVLEVQPAALSRLRPARLFAGASGNGRIPFGELTGSRPLLMTQLLDPERKTRAALDALGVPYDVVPIDPQFADTTAFCERYGYPPDHAGNTIIVASKKEPRQYAACVVTATTRLDVNHAVRDLLGVSKASFASADEMTQLTGMTMGGVTVFGLPDGLPIFVDERVMGLEYVILGTGGRNGKVKVSPEVFRRMANVRVVRDLALGREA